MKKQCVICQKFYEGDEILAQIKIQGNITRNICFTCGDMIYKALIEIKRRKRERNDSKR